MVRKVDPLKTLQSSPIRILIGVTVAFGGRPSYVVMTHREVV
jgi:hypothetical protein